MVNPQANLVIVHALPQEHRNVERYLRQAELILNQQVILEAKIIEVELNAGFKSGINWNLFGFAQSGNQDLGGVSNITPFASIFTLTATSGNSFSGVLKLLETQGRVRVLSSPRISTINNQKAVIKVGTEEYFVTDITSNVATAGAAANTSENIQLTPFFSGIALDVTPQIDEHNAITLHIHPVISEVTERTKEFTVSSEAQAIPLAVTSVRESDSVVHAWNKQVIVIGGLMQDTSSQNRGNTPLLSDIPGLGQIFQDNNHSSHKSELVILLKPIVVSPHEWNAAIKRSMRHIRSMRPSYRYQSTLIPKPKKITHPPYFKEPSPPPKKAGVYLPHIPQPKDLTPGYPGPYNKIEN